MSSAVRAQPTTSLEWPREVAVALGVPKLTATFNQVVNSDMFTRDTKNGQFSNVSQVAIRKNIIHPEMTAAPEWAMRVGNQVLSGAAAPAPAAKGPAKAAGRIGRLVSRGDLGAQPRCRPMTPWPRSNR